MTVDVGLDGLHQTVRSLYVLEHAALFKAIAATHRKLAKALIIEVNMGACVCVCVGFAGEGVCGGVGVCVCEGGWCGYGCESVMCVRVCDVCVCRVLVCVLFCLLVCCYLYLYSFYYSNSF